ncbi:MAG: steroid 3-ketoacyl-CoA thiolase, partial [Actinobacteria bacterium]|nr:steroid 3-ketoacyl-CoA thiolase [Actinomycetota bacterium]
MREAVIVEAVRTPVGKGKPGGMLSGWHPVDLLAETLRGLVDRAGIDPALVEDVITGCVSQAGEQAFNVGRNAVLAAGFPESVPATTIDRQCGSSQQAAHFAAQGVIAGAYDVAIACGVEVMSRVPMFSSTMGANPFGERILERYEGGLVQQGISAELIAAKWGIDREAVDTFSAESHR